MNGARGAMAILLAAGCMTVATAGDPVWDAFHRMFHMPSWQGPVCGPRYCGARHDEPNRPDPCDCRARWVDCHGNRQPPDLQSPWQMPPGRGFQPAEHLGWLPEQDCETCGHHAPRCGLFGWHWW
jgi:hypothetical protein